MKKAFSLILTLSLSAGLLAGCSGSGTEKRVVNVCSWGEYIDESLIQQFEEATGIEVNYQTSPSNEELYSSLTLGGTSYDVIVPSDYMISQLIEEDMLQPLDYDKIPNFSKIADRFKNLSYDPENLYTVPYTWGTLGIIYNSTMVDQPITSWDAMFDPQYADQVLMINNSRDALGIALMDLGYSVNTDSEEDIAGRLTKAQEEYTQIPNYDYLVVNDKVSDAAAEIISILTAEDCRTRNRMHLVEGI